MDFEKFKLFKPEYANVNYDLASDIIVEKGKQNKSFGISALAVHGLIESIKNPLLKDKIHKVDMIVPDGQPIRWALNSFYSLGMKDRVYGPTLTLWVLKKANDLNLKVYLYGSRATTIEKFREFIESNYPGVDICGIHQDRFRDATEEEDLSDINKINESGAHIILVGRGCPRQEIWVADHLGKINGVMMAVGAAFDFHAGVVKQAPSWMQRAGLEWLFRFMQEPRRLFKRYFLLILTLSFLF